MNRFLLLCFLGCCLTVFAISSANAGITSTYNRAFDKWGKYYFPYQDPRHWKAQGLAESGLDPKATSYCGARGIMQLMPLTAKGLGVDPLDIEGNIQGGIKYDRQLWGYWTKITDNDNRRNFTYASYNAGPGWIIKAQRLANGTLTWQPVADKLPLVTGKNAKQTQDYVKHINAFYAQIK